MAPPHGALAVFGSGPGVGIGVATLFAERGFSKIILLSRNAERLSQDAASVRSARDGISVDEIPVDLGNTQEVQKALRKVDELLNRDELPLDCVLYNAARLGRSQLLEWPLSGLENDLRLCTTTLYQIAQWCLPQLVALPKSSISSPSLLVTSGMLAKDPAPAMFSVAAAKAAQYSLMHSLYKAFGHCAVIVIAGTVAANSVVTNPKTIAEACWEVLERKRGFEVLLEDPGFGAHVKAREKLERE